MIILLRECFPVYLAFRGDVSVGSGMLNYIQGSLPPQRPLRNLRCGLWRQGFSDRGPGQGRS